MLSDLEQLIIYELSDTSTVKGNDPFVVGVPVMLPEVSIDKPGGNDPLARKKLYGGVPPVAV
jgi:hypothetical protein